MTSCQPWASSSHVRHPWFDTSISKRKRCETPLEDLDETTVPKRRRRCTLEHGFAYLSIGNPMDVPWTSLANGSCSFVPVNSSAMDSDMLSPQPVYTVEEPTVPEVNMKASSWYEPEPDSKTFTVHLFKYRY